MQALTCLAPLVAFFVTYRLRGLYVATAVLMVAMLALLALDWLGQRRVPPLHALSAMLVLILGAATLLLHNRLFIQWKPTLLFWAVSGAFIASFWVGERTLTQRLLSAALEERLRVSATLWRWLNLWSAGFYAALGALNLAVVHYASERAWVNFEMFGLTLLTLLFVAQQVLWLSTRPDPLRAEPGAPHGWAGDGAVARRARARPRARRARDSRRQRAARRPPRRARRRSLSCHAGVGCLPRPLAARASPAGLCCGRAPDERGRARAEHHRAHPRGRALTAAPPP